MSPRPVRRLAALASLFAVLSASACGGAATTRRAASVGASAAPAVVAVDAPDEPAGASAPASSPAPPPVSAGTGGDDVEPVLRASDGGATAAPRHVSGGGGGPTGGGVSGVGASSGSTGGGGGGGANGRPSAPASAAAVPRSSAAGDEWAVLIGVSHYQGSTHPTYGGAGDVAAFREALRRAGWADDHIVTLVDGAATGSAIRNALRWLGDRSTPKTFSVLHYSGHVRQTSVGDEYLWSVDNQFIANTEVGAAVQRVQGRAWIDIAGCESAGFDRGISSPSRLFTSSSGEREKSYEEPDWHESVWSGLVVDQGILQGQADADHDGRVSIQEAVRYGAERAPQLTARQSAGPQHPVRRGGDADGWFLSPPPPPPPTSPQPSPAGGPAPGPGGAPAPAPAPAPPPGGDRCSAATLGVAHCTG